MGYTQDDFRRLSRTFRHPHPARIPGQAPNPDLGQWGGVTWVYQDRILNGGVNAGAHDRDITPGPDNEFEIMAGSFLSNDNGVTANLYVSDDTGHVLYRLFPVNLVITANRYQSFPCTDRISIVQGSMVTASRMIVSGNMVLSMDVTTIGVNERSDFAITARLRGDMPRVNISTIPDGATHTVGSNKLF